MGCCESTPAGGAIPAAVRPKPKPKEEEPQEGKKQFVEDGTWPWTRPTPDDDKVYAGGKRTKRAVDFYHSKEYLQSFKILNAIEAFAYEAYQANDFDRAREILSSGNLDPPVLDPLSPITASPDDFFENAEPAEPVERTRGGSVAACPTSSKKKKKIHEDDVPRTPRTNELIVSAIRRCPLFAHLSSNFEEPEIVSKAMVRVEFSAGDTVFSTGEYPSDDVRGWYVVISGKGLIKRRKVKEVRTRGDFFGEAIVTNATCKSAMDVKASNEGMVLYQLNHDSYTNVLSTIAHQRREKYKEELRKVTVGEEKPFARMKEGDLAQLADCLQEKYYKPGDTIIKYGEPGRFAHIIMKGTVAVIGRKDQVPFKVCEFHPGEDPIGFLEFFSSEDTPTIADVIASEEGSEGVVTACVSRKHFEKCIGSVKDLLKDAADHSNVYNYYRETTGSKEAQPAPNTAP